MTITPAQAVAAVDSPRHDWDELSTQYKAHCQQIAAAAIAAHKVLEADVPLAQPEYMPSGPPAEMRLPGGSVAYQTVRAGEVVPGMWMEHHGDWRRVVANDGVPTVPGRVRFTFDTDPDYSYLPDAKVKVASTVDGARLAAERQAQQAEAYDQACEART